MKKINYSVKELKQNPSFRRFFKGIASAEEFELWNQWIESSTENRLIAKKAVSGMAGFEFRTVDQPDVTQEWEKVRIATIGKSKRSSFFSTRKSKSINRFYRVAAVVLLTVFVGLSYYFLENNDRYAPKLEELAEEIIINTEEGEHKTLQFSNGAQVVLNSNSSITYRSGDNQNSTIEIALQGEAWFEADPDDEQAQPAFAVTTPDGVIRDIGTKFLVTVENGLSRIVLQEGFVEVEPTGQENRSSSSVGYSFQVKKGEMVEFREAEIITRKTVNPTFYSSWATGVLVLAQSGVKEFAEYVEERFDVEVELSQMDLEDVRLNGTVYYRSLDELMRSVSEVIGIPVYRSADRDTVYIGM